jgi:hypothetical protein
VGSVIEARCEGTPNEGARRSDPAADGEGGSRWAWHRGGSAPLLEEPTLMNVLPWKPLHMATTPMSEAVMKMKRTKDDSYLSLQGDDGRGGLCLRLVGLFWHLRNPPLTRTAQTTRVGTTIGARATAGGVIIHIHSTPKGGTGAPTPNQRMGDPREADV